MVHLSRERGLDSVQASFEALPFSDESFDAVWSYTALLHIPKSQFNEALREIHRVLTPGGFFALGLIEGDDEQYKESKKVSMPRLFSYYQKQEIEEKVKTRGFEFVYFETFTPSTKNYLNFIFKKT